MSSQAKGKQLLARAFMVAMLGLTVGTAVLAQTPPPAAPPKPAASAAPIIHSPTDYNEKWGKSMWGKSVPSIINGVISRVLPMVGALFLLMFVWGGFQWLTAGGDSKKVDGAKTTIFNALIGVTLVSMAYFIVSYFLNVTAI